MIGVFVLVVQTLIGVKMVKYQLFVSIMTGNQMHSKKTKFLARESHGLWKKFGITLLKFILVND